MTVGYDRQALKTGIVHLGVGAFHRAHQAVYTNAVLNKSGGDWGICGVSLRSPSTRDALAANDNVYSVAIRGPEGTQLETIGALTRVLVAPEDPAAVIAAIADPQVQVVTLTITEKGYCLSPATGQLDLTHPDIRHDLAEPGEPRSAIGFLVAAMGNRARQQAPGLTVISCDNLSGNGDKLRNAMLQFTRSGDVDLAGWIDQNCSFPNTMVDRIVPAPTQSDLDEIALMAGHEDRAGVVTEPFSQWLIEKNFAGPVPEWDAVGAEFVAEVAPFERMKLRLLNASHSTMAYLGSLAGYRTVHEVIGDSAFAALIRQLMAREMAPTLTGLSGYDLAAYQQSLMQRFANPNLPHLTRQIAMDGSQKIPERLLPAIIERLERGQPVDAASCALAGWIYYTMSIARGELLIAEDPMQEVFANCLARTGDNVIPYLDAMLEIEDIFPAELAGSITLRQSLHSWLQAFDENGVLPTVHAHWMVTEEGDAGS